MTRAEAMEQLERYVHAGYRQPEDIAAAFDEWFAAFASVAVEDVAAAIGRMVQRRTSSFWPTPGELREHLAAVTAGRVEQRPGCQMCGGTTWIEAPPYRANGGLVYQGVVRCTACNVPAPNTDYLANHQTPMDASELREWAQARSRQGGPTTRAEFALEMAAIAKRVKTMPKARLRLVGEDDE